MLQQTFKEDDIRPSNLMIDFKNYMKEDIKYINDKKKSFVRVNCPACDSNLFKAKFRKYNMEYCECKKCKTVYINPRPTENILIGFYKQSKSYRYWNDVIFPASEKTRRLKIFKPRVNKTVRICQKYSIPTNTLIEVGCGFGSFLEELASKNMFNKIVGIEPNPDLAATCRKKGLKIIEKTIEEVPENTLEADIVVSFEVIEHIFSPSKFLRSCNKILKRGGIVVITCPNILGFDIQTLGKKSDAIDVEHLNYFNPNSLSSLLEKSGFVVMEKQTPGVLDADLVKNKIKSGFFSLNNSFLESIIFGETKVVRSFQKFLQENLLSSNMLLIARKL
jgi:2-polyprenyl-3-methyl-5-hydroxy-6-metoxy-1,4-benzoquinol methylase